MTSPRTWAPGAFTAMSLAGLVVVVATAAAFASLLALVDADWGSLESADVIGFSIIPVRINAPPQVAFFELAPAGASDEETR